MPPSRDTKADTVIELEHGKPLIFGKNRDKGIRLNGLEPEVVELGKGITEDDLLFHDEQAPEPSLAYLLSRMRYEDGFPEPIGVFRAVEAPRYDEEFNRQIEHARKTRGPGDLNKLFNSGETWAVQSPKEVPARVTLPPIQAGAEVEEAAEAEAEYRPIPATEVERSLLNDHVQALRPHVRR